MLSCNFRFVDPKPALDLSRLFCLIFSFPGGRTGPHIRDFAWGCARERSVVLTGLNYGQHAALFSCSDNEQNIQTESCSCAFWAKTYTDTKTNANTTANTNANANANTQNKRKHKCKHRRNHNDTQSRDDFRSILVRLLQLLCQLLCKLLCHYCVSCSCYSCWWSCVSLNIWSWMLATMCRTCALFKPYPHIPVRILQGQWSKFQKQKVTVVQVLLRPWPVYYCAHTIPFTNCTVYGERWWAILYGCNIAGAILHRLNHQQHLCLPRGVYVTDT